MFYLYVFELGVKDYYYYWLSVSLVSSNGDFLFLVQKYMDEICDMDCDILVYIDYDYYGIQEEVIVCSDEVDEDLFVFDENIYDWCVGR